ncbi:MAG: hypothetical protein HC843_13865, partial [Sphingomonadales bacterium]|nr:hypothetical protein [Sphingomonadales bacterium]
PPPPPTGNVTISGQATFDKVTHSAATNALNYNVIVQAPIRNQVVEAADASGAILATGVTDTTGRYSLTVPAGTQVRIRVQAKLLSTSGATYDIEVLDNTNARAPYILAGSLASSGSANSTRNLNAPSGWGGTSYTGTRAAGPFAITDSVFEAVQDIVAVDSSVAFTPLDIYWSVNNRPASGSFATGNVGTSFFTETGQAGFPGPFISILGAANSDTDEYDSHVIIHEFGHYFEGTLSRSDSIGGSHNDTFALDPRLAFGEGFGNAFSGMILDDPEYRDSFGANQASGFEVNVEDNVVSPTGWFNEGSVASILYDVYDSNSDGSDNISAGFAPIYRAFRSDAYRGSSLITNLHSYMGALSAQSGVSGASLDALIAQQSIGSRNADMSGETNNGGIATLLPFYKNVTVNGAPVTVCSTNAAGTINRLGNYDFARLNNPTSRSVTVTVTATSGPNVATTDPLFQIFNRGVLVTNRDVGAGTSETQTLTIPAGNFIIAVASFVNISGNPTGDRACYSLTVTA